MRLFLLLLTICSICASAQNVAVYFNHAFLTLDSADISAIRNSDFIKNEFAGFSTKTTIADSGRKWTGSYIHGIDSYFEMFGPSDVDDSIGVSGIGFSVDIAGDMSKLDSQLKKDYKTVTELNHRKMGDKMIPWFTSLKIDDSAYFSNSHIYCWVMEYTHEYFDYNHFGNRNDTFSRIAYLKQYEEERKNKILKKFTGIVLNVTPQEKAFMSKFLSACGYTEKDDSTFISPDNFSFEFKDRTRESRYSINSLQFETNSTEEKTIAISKNVQILLRSHKGLILFQ